MQFDFPGICGGGLVPRLRNSDWGREYRGRGYTELGYEFICNGNANGTDDLSFILVNVKHLGASLSCYALAAVHSMQQAVC